MYAKLIKVCNAKLNNVTQELKNVIQNSIMYAKLNNVCKTQ